MEILIDETKGISNELQRGTQWEPHGGWGKPEGRRGLMIEAHGRWAVREGIMGDEAKLHGRWGVRERLTGDEAKPDGRQGQEGRDGSGDAFLLFSFLLLIVLHAFKTVSFVLCRFSTRIFQKLFWGRLSHRFSYDIFPRKIFKFCFTENCFVKLVIFHKNLPQERFSIFSCLDRNFFIRLRNEIY